MTVPTYSLPVLPANLEVRVNNTQVMVVAFSLVNKPLANSTPVANTKSFTTVSQTLVF